MRRRLYVRYGKRYRRVTRKRKTWKIRIGRRWCRLRRRGRTWRFRRNRRWKRLRRFRLRLRIGRRYKRIKRVRRRWRLFTKKRWRPIRCDIRRFIRYRKKRVWLKRRGGKWKARFGRRWRKIRIRMLLETINSIYSVKLKSFSWSCILVPFLTFDETSRSGRYSCSNICTFFSASYGLY